MKVAKYNLTNPQKSIFLTEQFYSGTTINNICGHYIIHSNVNLNLLELAINKVIENNDNLQLHFTIENGIPLQFFSDYKYVNIDVLEVPDESYLHNLEQDIFSKCFDVTSSNNLYEFKLFKFENNHGGFLLNFHHLLADSWGGGIICRQIIETYNFLVNNTDVIAPIPFLNKFSYLDFINSEHDYITSDKYVKDEQYWNNIFSTIPSTAIVPSKNCNPVGFLDCSAKRNTYNIPKDIMELINSFCKQNKISAYNFFMSIYAIYISKTSGINDFVIGTPILNRTNFAQKNTSGMFVTTLPVRINLTKNTSFAEFAKNIAVQFVSMFRHQKYPYQNILENLRKSQSDLPNLYNTLISYQITKTNSTDSNCTTNWTFNNNCADNMQIHIMDLNDSGSITICYDYQTYKYSSIDIDNIHNRILNIINQIFENNNIFINDLNVITKNELTMINNFNNTNFDYDYSRTIVDLFEKAVSLYPNNTAVICNNSSITYNELNKKANQLAHYLINNNISKNDLVGVMTSRSLEMIISLLAIAKVGGTYVPIDPCYPEERVLYLIENSKAKAVLVDSSTYNNIENIYKINISLDKDFYNDTFDENCKNLNIEINPNDLLYVIYTSGSTGKPKGVMISHNNVHNFLIGTNNIVNLKKNSTFLSLTTVCFDIFGLELWGSLTNGLCLVLANEEEQNNTELLNKLCLENHVEMLQTTPSRISFLLKDTSNLDFLKNINTIMLGGEGLPKTVVENIFKLTNVQLFNMYGPTETTIWSTISHITNAENISIGKPISNTFCYILNDDLKILPPYSPGILYIGGKGVSKGYYNRPELTLEKFIHYPNNSDDIIYNTGDLAYYDEGGNIYHLGRSDFQVKLRGYRIELGEIENKILSYPNITETAVIADNNCLICYYTSNKKVNESNLISYLLGFLPDYMVPSDFIKLDEIPLTPNGKLDRKCLPSIIKSEILEVLPETDTEKLLAKIISKVTNNIITNINTSFMALGLDSLGIIQVQTELLSNNINLTTHEFYKYPTIKKLAKKIDTNTTAHNEQVSEIPDKFKHYPDEILSKISSMNIDENILGNVFLTGSNGFIGIHILNELLQNTDSNIYCLVRGNSTKFRFNKLNNAYKYYFNADLTSYINNRVFIIGGDTSFENLQLSNEDLKLIKNNVKTIINTAAIVKHYGKIEDFVKNNINGTQNVLDLAFNNNLRLIHLSSISVSGNYLVKQDNHNTDFSENDLYIGQHYEDNNYVYSKMESEKLILKYMEKGLTAQILRIGIVSGRYSDGFFQKKINENAFYGRIKSIIDMHAISDSMTLQKIEFTPVDLCAKAIITLAKNSIANNKIFNIYNHNLVTIFKILETLKKLNINVNILNSKDFNNYILQLSKTEKDSIKGIINDFSYDENNMLTINYNFTVNILSKYTQNYLHLLNFDWPVLNEEYLYKILKHMKDVSFI